MHSCSEAQSGVRFQQSQDRRGKKASIEDPRILVTYLLSASPCSSISLQPPSPASPARPSIRLCSPSCFWQLKKHSNWFMQGSEMPVTCVTRFSLTSPCWGCRKELSELLRKRQGFTWQSYTCLRGVGGEHELSFTTAHASVAYFCIYYILLLKLGDSKAEGACVSLLDAAFGKAV